VENHVDVLDKQRSFAWIDAETGQDAIAGDSDDLVTEFRVLTFDLIEELWVKRKMRQRL